MDLGLNSDTIKLITGFKVNQSYKLIYNEKKAPTKSLKSKQIPFILDIIYEQIELNLEVALDLKKSIRVLQIDNKTCRVVHNELITSKTLNIIGKYISEPLAKVSCKQELFDIVDEIYPDLKLPTNKDQNRFIQDLKSNIELDSVLWLIIPLMSDYSIKVRFHVDESILMLIAPKYKGKSLCCKLPPFIFPVIHKMCVQQIEANRIYRVEKTEQKSIRRDQRQQKNLNKDDGKKRLSKDDGDKKLNKDDDERKLNKDDSKKKLDKDDGNKKCSNDDCSPDHKCDTCQTNNLFHYSLYSLNGSEGSTDSNLDDSSESYSRHDRSYSSSSSMEINSDDDWKLSNMCLRNVIKLKHSDDEPDHKSD